MELYIEYVIIDNLILDFLILKTLTSFFKIKIKKLNFVLYIVLGCVFALILPYVWNNLLLGFLYKILVSIVLVMILRKFNTFKEFVKYYATFILLTFAYAGFMYGILNLLGLKNQTTLCIYSFEFPMSVLLIIVSLCYWLINKMLKMLQYQLKVSGYLYNIKMIDGEESVEAVGFFDSGNNVTFEGNAVNIISINLFMKLYKNFPIEKLIFRNINNTNLKNVMYIGIEGLSLSEKFLSFTIDKIEIKNKVYENVRLAVSMKNFENFDCILHQDLIGGM